MTRAEYERQFGAKPVISSSTLDTKPAPARMTRQEYESIFGQTTEQVKKPETLGGKLLQRGKDFISAPFAEQGVLPGTTPLRAAGAVTGAIADVAGAIVEPYMNKAVETISDIPMVQKFASKNTQGIDLANAGIKKITTGWGEFEENNPNIAQDIKDVTNILSVLTPTTRVTRKIAETGIAREIARTTEEKAVQKTAEEIFNIENNYVKLRKNNRYTADAGDASRIRIAKSGVLKDAVDADGTIKTLRPGGAVEQYKALYLDGTENIVRKNLELQGETVPLDDIRLYLTREIGRSGLEGGDLVTALNGIQRELKGLQLRARDGQIGLEKIQDSKIATTKNINFQTPPETATYRKAVARAYKTILEEKSTKFNVKEVNEALAPYLQDIKRLEDLEGRKVKGARLGKYVAQGTGSIVGMAAGAAGGPVGAGIGAALGGEIAGALKGASMAKTFGRNVGQAPARSAVLERAVLKIPDKKVIAPKGTPKTKEISRLEKYIEKNVSQQKKAIEKGDFALVKALKEIYQSLVTALKSEIERIKNLSPKEKQGGFVKNPLYRENSTEKKSLMSSQNQAPIPPKISQSIPETVQPKAEMRKYPEWVTENIHPEDIATIQKFIDSYDFDEVLPKKIETDAYRLMEYWDINADQPLRKIVNKLDGILNGEVKVKATNKPGRPAIGEPTTMI